MGNGFSIRACGVRVHMLVRARSVRGDFPGVRPGIPPHHLQWRARGKEMLQSRLAAIGLPSPGTEATGRTSDRA